MRPSKLPKVCVCCGATERITEDHLPPRCLFATSPASPVIVPSCMACNCGASKDDEYFRWALSFRLDVADHPEIDQVTKTTMRSLERPQAAGFRRSVIGSQGLRNVLIPTPYGSHVELGQGYEVDLRRLNRVARRVMLGLFAHEHGRRLPDTHEAFTYTERQLFDLDETMRDALRQDCAVLQATPPRIIGEDVLSYWIGRDATEPNNTLWALVFYQRVRFIGITRPRGPDA